MSVVVETDGPATVIRLVGSVRCATVPVLRDAVDAVLAQRPATVVLDLSEATADDELGLWVLPAMAGDANRQSIELVVAVPDRALRVRLRRLGGHPLEITDALPAPREAQRAMRSTPATVPGAPQPAPPRRSTARPDCDPYPRRSTPVEEPR